MLRLLDAADGAKDVEHSCTFHGGPACDGVVPCSVGFRGPARRLGNIQRNGEGSPAQLVTQVGASSRDLRRRCHCKGDELNGAPVHIKPLKAEHVPGIGRRWP